MPSYRIELTRQAERALRRIAQSESALYARVARAVDELGSNPFQGKPLKGELKGRYSYRVGSYRILYLIHRHHLLVVVIDVGHRRGIYR